MADTEASGQIEQWIPLLYEELRRLARRERWRISSTDTIGTTALVNEAYLRLSGMAARPDRAQFLGLCAIAMRRLLVDRVRTQLAAKRGGRVDKLPLEAADEFVVEDDEAVLRVNDALEALAALNPRLARVVECRFFAGYSETETAEALGVSVTTVQRDWATARAWLKRELQS
jgi:RNA polymerase sigma factor (TIGR02999 family)